MHSNLIPVIEEKDAQIKLKEVEIKKYREQILNLATKN